MSNEAPETEPSASEQIDRMTANLSAALSRQITSITGTVRTFGDAVQRMSDQLLALFPTVQEPAPSAPAGTGGGLGSAAGVVSVYVTNGADHPVPTSRAGRGSRSNGIFGGIGSFFGNLLGGAAGSFVAALASPMLSVVVMGEMLVLAGMAIRLMGQLRGALQIAERIVGEGGLRGIVDAIGKIVNDLFTQLTAAGILPVARLVASVLLLFETGIRIGMFYFGKVVDWAISLLDALNVWLGRFIMALGGWMAALLDNLVTYVGDLWSYLWALMEQAIVDLMHRVVQGIVEAFSSMILRFVAAGQYVADTLRYGLNAATNGLIMAVNGLIDAINAIASFLGITPVAHVALVNNPEPDPLASRLTAADTEAAALALALAARLFPSAGRKVERPSLAVPDFTSPGLKLPKFEDPGSALEWLFGTSGDATRPDTSPSAPPAAAPKSPEAAPAVTPVRIDGGIHVTIQTQTLDESTAEATGRTVASRIYEELQRLVEVERFRRGLPTGSVA